MMFFYRYKIAALITLILAFSIRVCAQNNYAAFEAADTTGFSVNHTDGWKVFNSYLSEYKSDSVNLEIILQHGNNINWTHEQYVGRIKISELIPKSEQNLSCSLVVSSYNIRIDDKGKCYLRLSSGTPPQQDPVIIPLKVVYRKH